MPNIRSASKRMRQNIRLRAANRGKRSTMRTTIKKIDAAITAGNAQEAAALLPQTVSVIGKLAQKGLIHQNNAARHISRLSRKVSALAAGAKTA
jgi:small subunit ribosomal protein S20